jgi:hypothetical protein
VLGQVLFLDPFSITILAVLGLLVLALVAVGTRDEPDPTNRRPYGIYLFLATFFALVITLAGMFAVLQGLGRLAVRGSDVVPYVELDTVGPVPGDFGGPGSAVAYDDYGSGSGREGARAVVEGAVAALAGLLLLRFHALRARELADDPSYRDGAGRRTLQVYLYGTLFALVFALAGVGVAAARGLLGVIFGQELLFPSRDLGFRDFLVNALFWVVLAFVFRFHWRRAEALRVPPRPEEPPPGVMRAPPPDRPPREPAPKRATARKPAPRRRPPV